MADDKIREGDPNKPRKKKAPPPDDDDPPRKKRPAEDEDEEPPKKKKTVNKEDEEPVKKKKRVRADDDDEDDDDERGSGGSALSALMPVGGSVFALLSLWIGLLSVVLGGVALASSFDMIAIAGIGKVPRLAGCFLPMLWPISLISGGLSFLTHKHKKSYGSIAGNMRAVIGILLSLGAMGVHGVLLYLFFTSK